MPAGRTTAWFESLVHGTPQYTTTDGVADGAWSSLLENTFCLTRPVFLSSAEPECALVVYSVTIMYGRRRGEEPLMEPRQAGTGS